jgi:hypothetical protein
MPELQDDKTKISLSKNDMLKKIVKLVVFGLIIGLLCYIFMYQIVNIRSIVTFYVIIIVTYLWIDMIFPNQIMF